MTIRVADDVFFFLQGGSLNEILSHCRAAPSKRYEP